MKKKINIKKCTMFWHKNEDKKKNIKNTIDPNTFGTHTHSLYGTTNLAKF